MRLWHQKLIHYLPHKQLLGQHRECCALRGLGWGKKHSVVDYVFQHPYSWLFYYHHQVMIEMQNRGYKVKYDWLIENYRGQKLLYADPKDEFVDFDFGSYIPETKHKFDWWWNAHCGFRFKTLCDEIIYPEHNNEYLKECIENLKAKNANLTNGKSIAEFEIQLAVESGL